LVLDADQQVGTLRMELPDEGISLEEVEKELLLAALQKHNWNQTRAASYLRITRSTLLYRMQKFELERPRTAAEAGEERAPSAEEHERRD
jgi:two-component system NtrC family response regulator